MITIIYMKERIPGSNIRLFFAVFFLFSFLNSIFGEFGLIREFNPENIPGVLISLLITISLFRSYIKTIKPSEKKVNNKATPNEKNLDKEVIVSNDMPDLVELNEGKSSNGYNPISDNEGMLSRIFRGKGDRY
tara:strand:+ start:160 stop:558 length:399 start_codon:yes stop_codon:yes gene_type:complete